MRNRPPDFRNSQTLKMYCVRFFSTKAGPKRKPSRKFFPCRCDNSGPACTAEHRSTLVVGVSVFYARDNIRTRCNTMPSYVRILRTHACGTSVDKRMRSKQGILRMENGRSVERRPRLGTEGSVGEACAVGKGFESCGEVGCLYFGWHCARLHASNANVQGDDDVRQGIVGERASERAGHHHR